MRRLLPLILCFLFSFGAFSQSHEWAEPFTSPTGQVIGIDLDEHDNIYVVGSFRDSLIVGNSKLLGTKKVNNSNMSHVCKLNSFGEIEWMRSIQAVSTNPNSTFVTVNNVKVISSNKIVVYGTFIGGPNTVLYFGSNDSIVVPAVLNSQTVVVIATYDSLGNVLNFQTINKTRGFFIGLFAIGIQHNGFLDGDDQENVYITFNYNKTNTSPAYIYTLRDSFLIDLPLSARNGTFIAKLNSNLDSILWVKEIARFQSQVNYSIAKIRVGRDNNLYIASNFTPSPTSQQNLRYLEFQDTTYWLHDSTLSKGILVIMDSLGNVIQKGFINHNIKSDYISSVDAIDTSNIFIVGAVKDTFTRNNTDYYTQNPLPPDNPPTSNFETMFPYVAKIGTQNTAWIQTPNKPIVSRFFYTTPYTFKGGIDKENYFYTSVSLGNNSIFGGLNSGTNILGNFVKFDTLGNALWILSGPLVQDLKPTMGNELIYGGRYTSTLNLNPYSLPISKGTGFLAKTTDYSITRGDVSDGPYCAGDTFLVPYTQIGVYDTVNYFIAELSDEEGNFDGGERELGRIKAFEDSTIIGQLPLFQVASSPNYRIRVRSTHPPVQSFYRRDSLRLLIYSRDKADPGPPEWVCREKPFMLNTFGGTAWEWSPTYRMNDSSLRTPTVIPDTNITYQIVISDSSGCGEPDTAFKTLLVRPDPKVFMGADTLEACHNLDISISARFEGGDSSGYYWQWYYISTANNWEMLREDSLQSTDTLQFRLPSDILTGRDIALILTDSCSPRIDTAYIHIRLKIENMQSHINATDSFFCYQSEQTLIANFTGGDSNTYTWQWFETGFETPFNLLKADSLKTSDSLAVQLLPQNTLWQRYALVSQDECTPFVDTTYFTFNIVQNQPRATISPQDSAVCNGTPITLLASIDSGTALGHHWKWLDENETVLQSDTGFVVNPLEVTPDFSTQASQTYTFILYDNCSPYSDTATLTVFPREPLQAIPTVFDTTLCSGQELTLSASGTGGDSNNYQFEWFATPDPSSGGEWILLSTEETLNFLPSTENNSTLNTHNLKLVLEDNCMPFNDTVEVLVRVLPKLQAEILNPNGELSGDTTVCFGSEIMLSTIAKGGDSTNYTYEWFWNDSLISTESTVSYTPTLEGMGRLSLILSDDCTVENDTVSISIIILPPLSVLAQIPDTLCLGEEIELIALPSGGIDTNYLYQWILNGNIVSGKDSFTLNGFHPSPSTIELVLSDGCSSPNDTFTHEIYIRPALTIDLSASTLCANPTTTLTANPTGGSPENYSIQWEATPDPSSGGEWNPIGAGLSIEVTPNQLTTYKAILTDGCSADTAFAQIQIDKLPTILELTASPTEGCEPLEVEFQLNTSYPNTYSYKLFFTPTDSAQSPPLNNPSLSFTYFPGNYTPSLAFTSQNGCSSTITGPQITVHPRPIASFTYLPEEPDMDSAFVQFKNHSIGATNYNWTINPFGTFTDFEPEVEYKDTGYFDVSLIAISDQDCRDTTTGQVYIRTNYRVFLPNAFSPNGDGLNDVFRPTIRGFANMQFRVYNRWGELIYTSNSDEGWDGTYQGKPAQMDVYFYTLNVLNYFGERQSFTGTVQLIR